MAARFGALAAVHPRQGPGLRVLDEREPDARQLCREQDHQHEDEQEQHGTEAVVHRYTLPSPDHSRITRQPDARGPSGGDRLKADCGTPLRYGARAVPPETSSGGPFALRRVVGAERLERSTSSPPLYHPVGGHLRGSRWRPRRRPPSWPTVPHEGRSGSSRTHEAGAPGRDATGARLPPKRQEEAGEAGEAHLMPAIAK